MLPAAALTYALQVLGMIPQLIGAGQSIMGLVTQAQTAISNMIAEKRGPTAAEWAAHDAMRDALHREVQA